MTTTATGPVTAGRGTAAPGRGRRRNRPLVATGVVLVLGCAGVSALGWLQAGHREPVLALARPVPAGQVLTAGDLRVVRVSVSGPVALVPASQEGQVTGATAAVTLPAGSLLTSADTGPSAPPAGQVRLGVALKPGQYPPDLAAGQTVDVLAAPATSATAGSTASQGATGAGAALPVGQAVVLSVTGPGAQGSAVVELQVSQDAMPQVAAAAAAGLVSLATTGTGG